MATGVLCGCGGGGASENVQAPSLPIYIAGATLKATDSNGNTWTATYSSTSSGTMMINGQVAYGTATFFTASKEGVVLDSEHMTEYALMDPYSPLSRTIYFDSLPGRLSPGSITSYDPLPSTLTAGASGSLSSGTFGGCSCSFTEAYSVTQDGTVLLNIHLAYPDFGLFHGEASMTGLYSGASTITYSINGSGAAALVEIQTTINGTLLTFRM
jgi:hypothetical protein